MTDFITIAGAMVGLYVIAHVLSNLLEIAYWAFADWKNKERD